MWKWWVVSQIVKFFELYFSCLSLVAISFNFTLYSVCSSDIYICVNLWRLVLMAHCLPLHVSKADSQSVDSHSSQELVCVCHSVWIRALCLAHNGQHGQSCLDTVNPLLPNDL
jgi:hypothetical protein